MLVAAVNVFLLSANPFRQVDPFSLPAAKTWSWWTTRDYEELKKPPDIVLMGSSLLMNPVWMQEASFLNKPIDIVKNRDVHYLPHALKEGSTRCGDNITCFNFALPGGMISDDYMVVRSLFDKEHSPKIAVLGLCPMDVIDDSFFIPAASGHFKYLKRFTDISDIVSLAMPQPWQRVEYYVNQMVYVAGRKSDIQVVASEWFQDAFKGCFGPLSATALLKKEKKDSTLAIYENEIKDGTWLAYPIAFDRFQDNSSGVKKRYAGANKSSIARRVKWLRMCLDLCREKNIEPIVLNMPFMPQTVKAFPNDLYNDAVAAIRTETEARGFKFFDMNATGKFDQLDFTDACHMDASGGKKVIDMLARLINEDRKLSGILYGDEKLAGKAERQL